MEWKDKAALASFVLFALAFGAAVMGVWPALASHLNLPSWISLISIHVVMIGSMAGLYRKASKGLLAQRIEVLLAAGIALMASAADLSVIAKIGGC